MMFIITVIVVQLGSVLLCASMAKHFGQFFSTNYSVKKSRVLMGGGYGCLLLGCYLCTQLNTVHDHRGIAFVVFLGVLTVTLSVPALWLGVKRLRVS